MRFSLLRTACPALSLLVCFSAGLLADGPYDLVPELVTNQEIPGLGVLTTWSDVKTNAAGDLVILASVYRGSTGSPPFLTHAVLLKRDGVVRPLLIDGEDLPDQTGKADIEWWVRIDLSDSGAVSILLPDDGVLLHQGTTLRWVARKGMAIPGTSLTLAAFQSLAVAGDVDYASRPLILGGNRVCFSAKLSDGSDGLFVADRSGVTPVFLEGDVLPGRGRRMSSLEVYDAKVADDVLMFRLLGLDSVTGEGIDCILIQQNGTLSTVALEGDPFGDDFEIRTIKEADVNSTGDVMVSVTLQKDSVRENRILCWSASEGLRTVVDKSTVFPGMPTGDPGPPNFSYLALSDSGAFSFIAEFAAWCGIYLSDGKGIEKIVGEGDPTPLGGVFDLTWTHYEAPGARFPFGQFANRELDIAFEAEIVGTEDEGTVVFLWSAGSLIPIPLKNQAIEGIDDQLLSRLNFLQIATGPRLLLGDSFSGGGGSALVSVAGAAPRISFLPLVAWGNAENLAYHTQLSFTNHSLFPGDVALEWFSRSGQPLHGSGYPESLSLLPGQVTRLNPSPSGLPMQTGYLKLTVEGGARISADATLELRDGSQAISRVNIRATQPARQADLPVDASSGRTAVALTNRGSGLVRAVVQLLDAEGRSLDSETIDFAARRQSNFMLEDFFGALPATFRGRVRVSASSPILVAALRLHGVESSSLPAFHDPGHRLRRWGYESVFPGTVTQNVLSPVGTFACVAAGQKLAVLKGGHVYRPLEGEEAELIQPGSPVHLIGFWKDDELLLVASESTNSPAIFSWKPGQLLRLVGIPHDLPDGRGFRVAEFPVPSFNPGSRGTTFAIGVSTDELFLLGTEQGPDKSELVLYRYDGQLHRLAAVPGSSAWPALPSVQGFDCRAPHVAFVVGDGAYSQLWRYSGEQLGMPADTGTAEGRLRRFFDIKLTSYGQVFFSAEIQTWDRGLFRFEEGRIVPVLNSSVRTIPSLPGYSIDFFAGYQFEINASDRVIVEAQARNSSFYFSTVLLEATDSTAPPALVFPTLQALADGEQHVGAFDWTDDGSLVFGYQPRWGSEKLLVWRGAEVETILDAYQPLNSSPDQPSSLVDYISKVWASPSGHVFFEAEVEGEEPGGIWKVMPDNHRSYILPAAPDIDESGIQYRSSITLQNRAENESRVRLTLVDTDGREAGSEELALAPGETRTASSGAAHAASSSGVSGFAGWARITVQGGDTMVTERLTLDLDGHFSQLHLAPATPLREVYLPATPGWSSESSTDLIGVAIVNPYNADQDVVIERIGEGLEIKEAVTVTLPASGQRAFYISDLLPDSPEVKTVRIRSTWPVAVTALNWSPLGICLQPVF